MREYRFSLTRILPYSHIVYAVDIIDTHHIDYSSLAKFFLFSWSADAIFSLLSGES